MSPTPKTVLFVCYGGGHAQMVTPVIRELQHHPHIRCEALALTIGAGTFERAGLPYKGFKDFITPADKEALAWGKTLAAQSHIAGSGVSEEESIAYHGLSYWDMVQRHGEKEAANLWRQGGRYEFLPVQVMGRIIDCVKPDMVVTTNSPRAERAAIIAANQRHIPTLSMVDLFGIFNLHPFEANYVAVLSQRVRDNIEKDQGALANRQFLITGNPAFDQAFDYRGPINYAWRKQHFPKLPDNANALLWLDDSGYFDKETNQSHLRTPAEIHKDLDDLARAAKTNHAYLLIRPHPSQQRPLFDEWIERSGYDHVFFAGEIPLYPLLNACNAVATYTSTAAYEAILMQKPVIQLGYYPGIYNMYLGDWSLARLAKTPEDLSATLHETFASKSDDVIQSNAAREFPDKKAAPQIADAIYNIVTKGTY